MQIVVLGAGNILLTDEGLGVRAIERLPLSYCLPPAIRIIDGGTSGMEMLEDLEGLDALIMVDAIRAGKPPGTPIHLAGDAVPVFFRSKLSPHQVSICDVLASLEFAGHAPHDLVLIGVEPRNLELGLELSPQVAARVPDMVAMAVVQLAARGVWLEPLRPHEVPAAAVRSDLAVT